jgi:hypothetical protein
VKRDILHDLSQLLISILLISGGFFFLYMIFFSGVKIDEGMKESLNQTTGAVLALISGVAGFWIGTSLSSMRKDAVIQNKQSGFIKSGMLAILIAVSAIALPSLQGCEAFGFQKAETFSQRYAYAQAELTAVRKASTEALQFGSISADQAQQNLGLCDEARKVLDAAQRFQSLGDLKSAEGRLTLAITLLGALQQQVRGKS